MTNQIVGAFSYGASDSNKLYTSRNGLTRCLEGLGARDALRLSPVLVKKLKNNFAIEIYSWDRQNDILSIP